MRQLLNNLKVFTDRFTFNQKVLMIAILAAVVVSVSIFTVWLQTEEMSVLFTNLSAEDSSTVLAELNKRNVEAELSDGGTTILVPDGLVDRLRVDLTAQGIPTSGTVGWGIFDGKQYGMTEFLQNVNFKRALEGELTRTIESISGIKSARIHLVMPKQSIFKARQSPATASVVLALGNNAVLGPSQIRGIQSLVSGSVEGLETPNVSVLDQYGVVLSENYDDDAAFQSDTQLAMKKDVDAYLSEKAESLLARVLGPGRAIVRVDADLNFERLEQQRRIYDPNQTVVRSEERTEASGGADGTNEQSTTNYEINETIETVVGEVGGVRGLTVAVFVDGRYEGGADGEGPAAYVPLSDEELLQIERVVSSTVGLDVERGDHIDVVNMQFQEPVADLVTTAGGGFALPGPEGLPGLVGRVLLFGLLAFMAFRLKSALGDMVGQEYVPVMGSGAASSGASAPADVRSDLMDAGEEIVDTENKLTEVREYVGQNPQEIADLVQAWFAEAEGGVPVEQG